MTNLIHMAATSPKPASDIVNAPVRADLPDMIALLSAVSTMLRDTITRFGEVSGRVTEIILAEGDRANPDIIVMLQDFDRLEQQFVALSDVLSSCNDAWCNPDGGHREAAASVDDITLAELKSRLVSKAHSEALLMATASSTSDDEVF